MTEIEILQERLFQERIAFSVELYVERCAAEQALLDAYNQRLGEDTYASLRKIVNEKRAADESFQKFMVVAHRNYAEVRAAFVLAEFVARVEARKSPKRPGPMFQMVHSTTSTLPSLTVTPQWEATTNV